MWSCFVILSMKTSNVYFQLKSLYSILFWLLSLFVCARYGWGNTYHSAHVWKSEDRSWNQFSPPTFTQVPEIELRSPGFHSKCLYALSHLLGLCILPFEGCVCYFSNYCDKVPYSEI